MMPGLVVKHTNNNVAILECFTPMPEQGIINDKLETMEIQTKTECHKSKADENQETPVKECPEISNKQPEKIIVDNTEKLENHVPEYNSTEVNENTEELSIENCKQNENKAEELPDTMGVPKYPDKKPPEKMDKLVETASVATAAAPGNCSENLKQNSISLNIGEPSTSKISFRKHNKLKTFLNKYNLTENELMLKLKNMKRLTKDRIKLDSVLSHKLNRNYLKILKRRRSIKNHLNNSATSSVVTDGEDNSDEYSTCESEDSEHENTSTTIEKTEDTAVKEEILENAHAVKNHDIESEALIESKLKEKAVEVTSNKNEISQNGIEIILEHPEGSITKDFVETDNSACNSLSQTEIEIEEHDDTINTLCATEASAQELNCVVNIAIEENCSENKVVNNGKEIEVSLEVTNQTLNNKIIGIKENLEVEAETNDKNQILSENTVIEDNLKIKNISDKVGENKTDVNTSNQDKETDVPSDVNKTTDEKIIKLFLTEENVQSSSEIEETKVDLEESNEENVQSSLGKEENINSETTEEDVLEVEEIKVSLKINEENVQRSLDIKETLVCPETTKENVQSSLEIEETKINLEKTEENVKNSLEIEATKSDSESTKENVQSSLELKETKVESKTSEEIVKSTSRMEFSQENAQQVEEQTSKKDVETSDKLILDLSDAEDSIDVEQNLLGTNKEADISQNSDQLVIDLDATEETNDKETNFLENNKEDVEASEELINDLHETEETNDKETNFLENNKEDVKASEELIIDLHETEETNDVEAKSFESTRVIDVEVSDELIIDLGETEESIDVEQISPEKESNLLETDEENSEKTNGTLGNTHDDNRSQNEGFNNMVVDESKMPEDFMTLLESLEKEVPLTGSPEYKQKEIEIVVDQDISVENAINILEDKNETCIQVDKDPSQINEVLSSIEEEPNFEARSQEKCIENESKEQCLEEEVQNISENSRSSSKELSPLTIMPNLFEDDDIRNKIKRQLELLRRNTRKSVSVEPLTEKEAESEQNEDIETDEMNLPSTPIKETPIENTIEQIKSPTLNTGTNLSDVLISNEGELAIINVVGGYVSENEDEEEEKLEDVIKEVSKPEDDELELEDPTKKIKRGISITDRLLMNLSLESSHIIKPTKTTDITKIKGWRSKTFNVINEEDVESDIEAIKEEHIDEVPPLVFFKKETNNSLENPIPGTSSDFVVQQPEIISKPQESLQEVTILPKEENKKSAFVSDYLETFLSTNSELKISYEVPKLVAEENISKPEEMPLSEFPPQPVTEKNTTTSYKPKQGAIKKAKPKTLAEKRRMLELDRRNELLHHMETNEQIYLKRLEYCEKRNKTEIANDIRNNLVANLVPFSRLCWKLASREHRQFAYCNGEKILLSGSAGGKNIIVPDTRLNRYSATRANDKVFIRNSSYRPGPLSKKPKLMTQENWECRVLKMPKIKLEVYPEQNKPLPLIAQQYLQLCRHDQFVVNKDWADFAVTAVQTKEKAEHSNKFEFDIPYEHGRNKILVRIPIQKLSPVKYPKRTYSRRFPEINVDQSIKDIVSDLLTCVENRELDTKIIKDDPDLDGLFIKTEKEDDRPLSPIDSRVQAIIKRPNAKRSKTTLELRRLNVQVIEVDVKEDEDNIPEDCMKDFCKLGCVCKSLRGASALIPEHCGREGCMLECVCSFGTLQKGHHQITLPAGTDLLSASTVVRLQDEAKRNLAKVEREFTQTVIKANNQTIMVGGGARDRTRRVPKVPKKYTNFAVDKPNPKGVSSYDKMMTEEIAIEDEFFENEIEKTPPKKKPEMEEPVIVEAKKPVPIWINKNKENHGKRPEGACRVVLNKMKLDHVIPWCMVHNLYKCHCGGKATFPENIEPVKPVQTPVEDTEYISYNPRFGGARHADTIPHTVTEVTEKYCARTKALPTNYYHARNKSQRFKADYAVMRQIEEKNTHFEHMNSNNLNKNKRKSLDTHETYSNDEISFDNQDLLVPLKKKSSYIKKRDAQSLLLPQRKRTSEIEEIENQAKRSKPIEEDEEDPLESVSLLERLNGSNNQNIMTVKTYQKVSADDLTKVVRKTKKQKPKVIMRDPDKVKDTPKLGPESLQLTTEDFVVASRSEPKLSCPEQKKRQENTHIVSSTAFIDYDRSYMGLLIPSKEWLSRFHKMLNPNEHTIVHQIRLLEWATMVKRQECNALQVWFNTKKYNNIILTEDRRRPSSGHVNVKTFKSYSLQNFKIPDIISSLLADKLPGAAEKASETYMILVYNGNNWEARGTIVLSGTTEICKQKLGLKPTPVSILSPNLYDIWFDERYTKSTAVKQYTLDSGRGIGTLIIKSTPSMSVEVRNNNEPASPPVLQSKPLLPKKSNELEIISIPPSTTSPPVFTDKNDDRDNETSIPVIDRSKHNIGSILAPLPTGGDLHRWFMLILENDFSVLRISFSKFHIKYTHLQTAINMARKSQKTVRIKTPPVICPGVSENFSIYACPESTQRIFFGPYGNRSDHGLETFRYVNGKLVNTKIYNKMRGNPEKKTSGYWFTHNSTMKNNLNLEPNYDEGSSGSECTTAVTSIDNVTKPQIELVDLTENDSDAEEPNPRQNEIDPLLNLLSVDLSKKIANDITIEPVSSNSQQRPERVQNMKNEIEIEAINERKEPERKRKSVQNADEEPLAKHPTLIDSIELDDDDEMPVLEPYNKEQKEKNSPNSKMPPLRPINVNSSKEKDKGANKSKNKCLYVITNIPGVGYFEIFFEKTKTNRQSMYTQIKGSKTTFQTINNAIKYLHYLCTKFIYFMPKTLKVKFSIVDSSDPPEMPKFKDEFLNGYHMISERGIFNILNINTKDLDNLGFEEGEIQKLLSYKCDLLIARNIKQLGTYLFGHEAAKKMPQEEILRMAPSKINLMEQQEINLVEEKKVMNVRQQNLLVLLNDLQRDIPESLQCITKQKITNILSQKAEPVCDVTNWSEASFPDPSKSIPLPELSHPLLSLQKLDSPAVVKPILTNPSKLTILGNSPKTMSPLPMGKFCRIVDGKLIVLDQNSTVAKAPPRLQVVPNLQPTMNILSPQQFQNLINPNPNDKNSKFELLVPITGLQSPATVVALGQNTQNKNAAAATSSSPPTLLVANSQPKVVDLTDD